MAGEIWFGTRSYMQWVPAPALNVDASKHGWNVETTYLNGGAYARRSWASHKRYNMSWNLTTRDRIRKITDYADGLYGQGPIYWADPFVLDTNMLPAYWASPFMGTLDGIILDGKTTRPLEVPTPNALGYPFTSAQYTISASSYRPEVWIPIPPGYTAWVGAHGQDGTGGQVLVNPTANGGLATTAAPLTMLSISDQTRVNASYDSTSWDGIVITLGGTGTVTLSGIIVQLVPTGSVPPVGGFISGQGHSGCSFAEQPSLTQYSAFYDRVGLSANFIETEAWK